MPIGNIASQAWRPLVGALAGGAAGYYGTPHIGGYEDVPKARRVSGYTDALLRAVLGAAAQRKGGFRALGRTFTKQPLKTQAGVAGLAGVGEIPPILTATLAKTQDSAQQLGGAAHELAQSSKVTSIPYNLQRLMQSSTARGAGVGAGAAGIGALLTGLGRRRTEREIRNDKSRAGMVGSDLLKYLIPAMVAGGVTGSMRNATKE